MYPTTSTNYTSQNTIPVRFDRDLLGGFEKNPGELHVPIYYNFDVSRLAYDYNFPPLLTNATHVAKAGLLPNPSILPNSNSLPKFSNGRNLQNSNVIPNYHVSSFTNTVQNNHSNLSHKKVLLKSPEIAHSTNESRLFQNSWPSENWQVIRNASNRQTPVYPLFSQRESTRVQNRFQTFADSSNTLRAPATYSANNQTGKGNKIQQRREPQQRQQQQQRGNERRSMEQPLPNHIYVTSKCELHIYLYLSFTWVSNNFIFYESLERVKSFSYLHIDPSGA
jgi:hypothetical protein